MDLAYIDISFMGVMGIYEKIRMRLLTVAVMQEYIK